MGFGPFMPNQNGPQMSPQAPQQTPAMTGPFAQLQAFQQFADQFRQTSTKSPQQVVQDLISSGRMSQDQFNQLSAIANQLTGRRG